MAEPGIHKSVTEKTQETKRKWLSEEEAEKVAMVSPEEDQNGSVRFVRQETGPRKGILKNSGKPVLERIPTRKELETLTHFAKRPAVNIEFTELSYSVRNHSSSGLSGKKQILKGVSGNFKSGELTAIMGSSGAGKSTLMNILAGYVSAGVTGSIRVNNHPRQLKRFHKLSAYIMQDDLIQPHLTVEESMSIAARLKLGRELTDEQKLHAVDEIIQTLGLTKCKNTRTERLSGGQRKRLSVGLELVNNPPVIFLDEPTTGLDIVSINQLIDLLKTLARQGRTVICTIHQPTASIFEQFDRVYVLARGSCVYQGAHDHLVPFLSNVGLECPKTYNPADYIIEIIQGENHECITALSSEIQNGKTSMQSPDLTIKKEKKSVTKLCRQETMEAMSNFFAEDSDEKYDFPTSFCEQFCILFRRRMLQQMRNKTTLWIMLCHHLISGSLLGTIFLGVGDDANRPFDNFKFVISVVVFFMYTHVMCPVLVFPAEVNILRREYFNRWYGLKSYFMALTVSSIPSQIIFGFIFITTSYLLSDQPMDISRFALFSTIGLLLGFTSEGWGLTIGSIFNEMNGSVAGPASIVPLLAVAVYGMGFGTVIEPLMTFFMSVSYLRYGIVGFSSALYGRDRAIMKCDTEKDVYCHYQDPSVLLKDLGMAGLSTENQILGLTVFLFLYRATAFLALRYRLTAEFSNKILNYAAKVLRHQ